MTVSRNLNEVWYYRLKRHTRMGSSRVSRCRNSFDDYLLKSDLPSHVSLVNRSDWSDGVSLAANSDWLIGAVLAVSLECPEGSLQDVTRQGILG